MSTITFYRQARRDGGIRTGIEIDDNAVLARFEEGNDDPDPALVWYVDVRCRGKSLPRNSTHVRRWLSQHTKTVTRLLNLLADEIPAGIDTSGWPIQKTARVGPELQINISCTAVRRLDASRLADILRDIALHWNDYVETLSEIEA